MEPFNLEKAKAGQKVVTSEGYDVTIYTFDLKHVTPIFGVIHEKDRDVVYSWHENGKPLYQYDRTLLKRQLFMKTSKVTKYIIIFDGSRVWSTHFYDTKDAALKYIQEVWGNNKLLSVASVEYEL